MDNSTRKKFDPEKEDDLHSLPAIFIIDMFNESTVADSNFALDQTRRVLGVKTLPAVDIVNEIQKRW